MISLFFNSENVFFLICFSSSCPWPLLWFCLFCTAALFPAKPPASPSRPRDGTARRLGPARTVFEKSPTASRTAGVTVAAENPAGLGRPTEIFTQRRKGSTQNQTWQKELETSVKPHQRLCTSGGSLKAERPAVHTAPLGGGRGAGTPRSRPVTPPTLAAAVGSLMSKCCCLSVLPRPGGTERSRNQRPHLPDHKPRGQGPRALLRWVRESR